MRFLLFNLAVIAALFFLFRAGPGGPDILDDYREDPLQAIRQDLESLAQDVAEGRGPAEYAAPGVATTDVPGVATTDVPGVATTDVPADEARAARDASVEATPEAAQDQPVPVTPVEAETVSGGQDGARDAAEAPRGPDGDPQQVGATAYPVDAPPQPVDPAVARRRAEVLKGVAPLDDGPGATPVEAGPPMSPDERLRKLYSLAEEMELLYVSKMTR
jgi:hypothetical protein